MPNNKAKDADDFDGLGGTEVTDEDLFDDEDDDDDLQSARSGFVTLDDLLDRVIIVTPTDSGSRTGDNGEYEFIVADVLVCDGRTTELIDRIPTMLDDFQLWGANVVSSLKPALRRGNSVVGVLGQKKAAKYRTQAWHLLEPTAEQMTTAKAARRAYRQAERAKRSGN